ncbi:hypothetical protein NOK12_00260, partial [Nocardioides sp. OK12]
MDSINVSSRTVDVTNGSVSVTITAHITDADSGFNYGSAYAYRGSQGTSGGDLVRTSGTSADGMYAATLTFPANSNPGEWSTSFFVRDVSMNRVDPPLGSFTVVNTGNAVDEIAPVVDSINVSSRTVDVTNGSVSV